MEEQNILTLLREAAACMLSGDMSGYGQRLKAAGDAVAALPEKGRSYGEWLLVSAPLSFTDMDKLLALYQEAALYIDGRSGVLPYRLEFFWNYYYPLAICNPTPGHMEENAEKLMQAVQLFHSFTGGGMGTDLCYCAQLTYLRGDLENARSLAKAAFETAILYEQQITALCAAETMLQVAMHGADMRLWHFAHGHIKRVFREKEGDCRVYAELLLTEFELALGLLQNIPEWIKKGDFWAVAVPEGYRIMGGRLCHGALSNALLMQMEYFSYSGQPVLALNAADMAQKIYGISNTISNAHFDLFRAGCWYQLGELENMRAALARAMEQIAPDGLWAIAAVFEPGYGEALYEAAMPYGDASRFIRSLGMDFWHKLVPFREKLSEKAPKGFTRRQREVLALLSSGMNNSCIADTLSISESTLKTHIRHIYGLLGISRREELAEALKKYRSVEPAFWVSKEK